MKNSSEKVINYLLNKGDASAGHHQKLLSYHIRLPFDAKRERFFNYSFLWFERKKEVTKENYSNNEIPK